MKKNKIKTAIILGYGEVGIAMGRILAEADYKLGIIDLSTESSTRMKNVNVMHINIPYDINFINTCIELINFHKPKFVVINSTVSIGTTRKIYQKTKVPIVHSPCRGIHPFLYKGIKTFVKYIGPVNRKSKELAKEHFKELKLNFQFMKKSETTEMAKLLSTTYYGNNIIFCKDTKILCDKYKTDFNEVYTNWNNTYNMGYTILNMKNVVRPVLIPTKGRIGGHCISENCKILKNIFNIAQFILFRNNEYKKENKND